MPAICSRNTSTLISLSLVICTALLVGSCNRHAALPEAVQDLVFSTLSGERIALAAASGPMLVNFWSTDCAICIHEMPELASVYDDYQDKGFELVAVAMPYDPPNKVLELVEKKGWAFPVALDIKGEAVASFATIKGTPTSYLLDTDGSLVQRYVGAVQTNDLRKELDKLVDKD